LLERGRPERQRDYLQTMYREIERLTHLIDGFLEISELDAGQTPLRPTAVNVNRLISDLMRDRQALAEARDLELVLEFDPHFNTVAITTDHALIARALSNIVDNALQYAPPQTCVTVSTTLRPEADQTWAVVLVHNAGPGLSPEEMPRMFERFYRGEAARDYRVPGAGLGLAIAQAIMQRLGGRLTVESQPDQGVTFAVWSKLAAS
jgi:signal transduction histidine kinase